MDEVYVCPHICTVHQ